MNDYDGEDINLQRIKQTGKLSFVWTKIKVTLQFFLSDEPANKSYDADGLLGDGSTDVNKVVSTKR